MGEHVATARGVPRVVFRIFISGIARAGNFLHGRAISAEFFITRSRRNRSCGAVVVFRRPCAKASASEIRFTVTL